MLSILGVFLVLVYFCSLLTGLEEFICGLLVVILVHDCHFFHLLVPRNDIIHHPLHSALADVSLWFFPQSHVEVMLLSELFVLNVCPILFELQVVHLPLNNHITNLMCLKSLSECIWRPFVLILKLFYSIFYHQSFHLFLAFEDLCLELLRRTISLYLLDCIHCHHGYLLLKSIENISLSHSAGNCTLRVRW